MGFLVGVLLAAAGVVTLISGATGGASTNLKSLLSGLGGDGGVAPEGGLSIPAPSQGLGSAIGGSAPAANGSSFGGVGRRTNTTGGAS